MQPDLTGQTAVVTGAGRGIGRAISLALAECGAHILLAARTRLELEETASQIAATGGSTDVQTTDVADEAQVEQLLKRTDELGRLDILVNNAGIGLFGPAVDFATTDFDRILQINLRGTFLCSRAALKRMIPAGCGMIINIASVVGFKGYPQQAAYTASKHGVMGLTKSFAAEAQEHGIRVSAILPGGVDTEMIAQARPDLDPSVLIRPEDIAKTVLYLLSLSGQATVDQIYIRRRDGTPF
ncbi:MAG: hypothetical protein CMJ81_01640 [Planctomycetaceae bacterium]|jgi:3-oxoacyl-[acyl-carrier protein] reductase|nr:hypothetical protein [Planctomycetaceae bacterium]MBP63788.1 hypothetical protein [Planctomycetaceae bacterium]